MELSLATFSAAARLIGAATFAFTSDIAARSGSSSPASSLSSSRVSERYSGVFSVMERLLVALRDRGVLDRVRIRDRVVREHVGGDGRVDRSGDVRVDQRHRGPLRQLLAGDLV